MLHLFGKNRSQSAPAKEAVLPAPLPRFPYLDDVPKRIRRLREEIYQVTPRNFAWRFNLNVSELNAIENGLVEPPRTFLETLISEYRVSTNFIDGEKPYVFSNVRIHEDDLVGYLKKRFRLVFIAAPLKSASRSVGATYPVFLRNDEYLPYVLQCELGHFRFDKGFLDHEISTVLHSIRLVSYGMLDLPLVLRATDEAWSDLQNGCFHTAHSRLSMDDEATDFLHAKTERMRSPDDEWNRLHLRRAKEIAGDEQQDLA